MGLREIEIPVIYHTDVYGPGITSAHPGEWYDLRAAEDVDLPLHGFRIISLGISMQLPLGYEAVIAPRSSTFAKYGIIQTNGLGVIDNAFCGDTDIWGFPAYCLNSTRDPDSYFPGTFIAKGDRICQFRILERQPSATFISTASLSSVGRGGFGSSGYL